MAQFSYTSDKGIDLVFEYPPEDLENMQQYDAWTHSDSDDGIDLEPHFEEKDLTWMPIDFWTSVRNELNYAPLHKFHWELVHLEDAWLD